MHPRLIQINIQSTLYDSLSLKAYNLSNKVTSSNSYLFIMIKSILPNLMEATSPIIKRHMEHRILKTHPKHLFQIIIDVDLYHQFLPLCTKSKILRHSNCGTMFDATLSVGLNPTLSEEYVSRVRLDKECLTVESKSIKSSVIESLSSRWKLKEVSPMDLDLALQEQNDATLGCAIDESTKWSEVQFEVEMSVRDPIMKLALDQVWEDVARGQMNAFERRCQELPFDNQK